MDKAREMLRLQGAIVEDIDVPREFDQILAWHAVLLAKEGQTSFLGQYLTDRTKINEQRIAGFVEKGNDTSREAQLQASDNLARVRPVFDEIASRYAVIITPSVVDEAPGKILILPEHNAADSSRKLRHRKYRRHGKASNSSYALFFNLLLTRSRTSVRCGQHCMAPH